MGKERGNSPGERASQSQRPKTSLTGSEDIIIGSGVRVCWFYSCCKVQIRGWLAISIG